MARKYNSEGYYSPTEYEAFTQIEKEERAVHKAATYRPLVYICSPYSLGCINQNIENARKYSRFAVEQHCIPITPHLLFPQFMDDAIPEERSTAMQMNKVLLGKCEQLWVFGRTVSSGMKNEIKKAKKKRIPIRYFSEDLEELK